MCRIIFNTETRQFNSPAQKARNRSLALVEGVRKGIKGNPRGRIQSVSEITNGLIRNGRTSMLEHYGTGVNRSINLKSKLVEPNKNIMPYKDTIRHNKRLMQGKWASADYDYRTGGFPK